MSENVVLRTDPPLGPVNSTPSGPRPKVATWGPARRWPPVAQGWYVGGSCGPSPAADGTYDAIAQGWLSAEAVATARGGPGYGATIGQLVRSVELDGS